MRDINEITGEIVSAAYRVHSRLGPGLLESVYETVMARYLSERELHVERQKGVAFEFEGMVFNEGLKLDLLIDGQVVVELKSVEKLAPIHSKQLLTYLRLMDLPIGLLDQFRRGKPSGWHSANREYTCSFGASDSRAAAFQPVNPTFARPLFCMASRRVSRVSRGTAVVYCSLC